MIFILETVFEKLLETLLANAEAGLLTLKRHKSWHFSAVADKLIAQTISTTRNISTDGNSNEWQNDKNVIN